MSSFLYRELTNYHSDSVNCLAFSADGGYLASGGEDSLVLIYAFREKQAQPLKACYPASVTVLEWVPSGQLFVGLADGAVHLLFIDSVKGRLQNTFVRRISSSEISSLAFNPRRRWLAVGSGMQVHVFDMTNMTKGTCHEKIVIKPLQPKSLGSMDLGDSYEVCGVHFMDRGGILLIAYLGGDICHFNLLTGEDQQLSYITRRSYVGTTALDATETYLSVFNLRDGFDIYDIRNEKYFAKIPARICKRVIVPSVFTSDGETIIVGASDGNVLIVDLHDLDATETLDHDGDIIQAVACSKSTKPGNLRFIATGSAEKGPHTYIKVWATADDFDHEDCAISPHSTLSLFCSCAHCKKMESLGLAAIAGLFVFLVIVRYNHWFPILWSSLVYQFRRHVSHPTSKFLAALGAAIHKYFSSPDMCYDLDKL